MATIVKLKDTDLHGILVGVGYGMFESAKPNMIFGDWIADKAAGKSQMAAVSTDKGEILWCETEKLTIVSIDGKKPGEHLDQYFQG